MPAPPVRSPLPRLPKGAWRGRWGAVRVAQVGVGVWGVNHARVLSKLGALAAICDADPERGMKLGGEYSVNSYTSIRSMLESEEFDAAIVCTPTHTHAAVAAQLLDAKKHVLVEKPMTYDPVEGRTLLETARRNGVILTCGYIERFNPVIRTTKRLVESKRYGGLAMLEFHRENKLSHHISDVGVVQDTAVHDIDTAVWLFGEAPEVVFARTSRIVHEHDDLAFIMLGFGGGGTAMISSNWISHSKIRTFSAVCSDAVIHADFISQEMKIVGERFTESPKSEWREPLLAEIQSFMGAVRGENKLIVSPEQAIAVTSIAEAALQSSRSGEPVRLGRETSR